MAECLSAGRGGSEPVNCLISVSAIIGENCVIEAGAIIEDGVVLGAGCRIGAHSIVCSGTSLGEESVVQPHCLVGLPGDPGDSGNPVKIGREAFLRSGTTIYAGVTAGVCLATGHSAVIRGGTVLGDRVVVGTHVVIDGDAIIGNDVRLQTGSYVTRFTSLGDGVFLGPYAKTANDRFIQNAELAGPVIARYVRVGAGAVILPGIHIGQGAIIGAGAIVTRDVGDGKLATGNPARVMGGAP